MMPTSKRSQLTFALDGCYVLGALAACPLRFTVCLRIDDDSVRGTRRADDATALSTVVLAVEGTELESTDHALFAVGVRDPHCTRRHHLVASWCREQRGGKEGEREGGRERE